MKIFRYSRLPAAILFSLASATAQTSITLSVAAAKAFLLTLDEKQRHSVSFAFDDENSSARAGPIFLSVLCAVQGSRW